MAANTRGRLRRLAEVRPERGRVLSVFLNLDPSEFAVGPARATEIHSVLNDAARRVEQVEALDHDAKQALREDLERVRATLEASDIADGGTQGVAVYACSPAGLFEVIRLPHPIETRAVVEFRPVIEPLVGREASDRWAVLLANRQTARIFSGTAERLEETDRVTDDVHAQHDKGGWSQANYQRSVEQDMLRHLAKAADVLFEHFKREPFDHLLVGSPQELSGEIEQRLHPYVKERLAGRLSVDVENTGPGRRARGRGAGRRAPRGGRGARGARPARRRSRPRGSRRGRRRGGHGGAGAGTGGDPAARPGLRRPGPRRGDRAGDRAVGAGDRRASP